MAIGKDRAVVGSLRTLFSAGTTAELSDGQLLERFATGRGEIAERAFATLVERHGPMVHRVCRGVLADVHDTQDAFQATFLVLVEKARQLWVRDSLGPWLHQVAFRTASCARVGAARRRRHEQQAAVSIEAAQPVIGEDRELGRVLHEEIERLPERFRAPLVLCDVQGRTHEQTARHLGWPVGTVKSRLSRARQRLRDRLRRRGVAPGAALLAAAPGLEASVPPALFDATIGAAAGTRAAGAVVRGSAAALAREVIQNMIMLRIIQAGALALVAGATATGIGLLAQEKGGAVGPGADAKVQSARADDVPDVPAEIGPLRITVTERGNLESSRNVDVINEVEGQTTILSILPEGTRVKKGDLVCELDSATVRDQIVNQEIAVRRARADYENALKTREVAEIALNEYVEGTLQREKEANKRVIAAAEAAVQAHEARIERMRRARDRIRDLMARKDPITPADVMAELEVEDRLARAQLALERARVVAEQTRARDNVLRSYTERKQITELKMAVEQTKANEQAKEAAYKLEQVKLEKLRRQIDKCKLYAPTDGFVLYANDPGRPGQLVIEEGAAVRERQLLFRLPDLAHMRVNAKVHEAMVDRLQPGMKAQVRVDAFPDRILTGTVKTVAPLPDPVSFGGAGVKVYSTHVELDEPFAALRPGMTAEVEILVEQHDNVLSVPNEAVLRRDGKDLVAVKNADGGFTWREVRLGATDGRRVEVKAGLEAGERVALNAMVLLRESERREIIQAPARPAGAPDVPRKKGGR